MRFLTRRPGGLAAVVLVLGWAPIASAQTADEIIEKSITAMGGRAAMQKLKTRQMTGTIMLATPAGEIAGTIEITNALPNKVRTVIKADLSALGAGQLVIDQRFDGTAGYVLDSLQGNRDITGGELDSMVANGFPHPFLGYKAQGISVKLNAKDKVGDRDAFVLQFETPAGSVIRQFVDAETYLPSQTVLKVSIPQLGEVEQTARPTDYRDVDGVKVPFKVQIANSMNGFTITMSKMVNNVAVDEKSFVKP
jgi:hypothetical protein